MREKTLGLTLSTLIILFTSFCVHKEQNSREVSNATLANISNEVAPDVITDSNGNQLFIYSKVDATEPLTTLQIRYQCAGSKVIKDWHAFNVAFYTGRSDLLEGSSVIVRYYPIALFDFSDPTGKSDRQELTDREYNLRDVCSNWK